MPNKRMAGPVLIDNAFRKSCLVSNINERPLISFIRNISASSLKPSVAKKRWTFSDVHSVIIFGNDVNGPRSTSGPKRLLYK